MRATHVTPFIALALPLGWVAAGCVGEDISAGGLGSAPGCVATNCATRPETLELVEPPHERCEGDPAFELIADLRVESRTGSMAEVSLAPDGTIWILNLTDSRSQTWVEHYASDGSLVGASEGIDLEFEPEVHLAVDAQGRAWIVTHVLLGALTPDDAYTESTTLHVYDADGSPARSLLSLDFIGAAEVAAGSHGGLLVAGTSLQHAAGGALLAVAADGETEWVQMLVEGVNLGGDSVRLVSRASGASALLRQRAFDPNFDALRYGLARYSPSGALVADALIGQEFSMSSGRPALTGDDDGNVILVGVVSGAGTSGLPLSVIRGLPPDGGPGFAWEVTSGGVAAMDRETGTAYVSTNDGIAAIPRGGARCGIAPLPHDDGTLPPYPYQLAYASHALYYVEQWGFGRWSIVP